MIGLFGAGGFLGRHTQKALREKGLQFRAYTRHDADITKPVELKALDAKPTVVVNLAARVPAKGVPASDMMRINAEGAVRICEWAIERGAKHFVYGSTLSVVARPWPVPLREEEIAYPRALKGNAQAALYAASKLAGEIACRALCEEAGVTFSALRFSALYGEEMTWQGVMPLFIDMALDGRVPKVNAGGQVFADFLHARCAANAVVAACQTSAEGIFNIASGDERSILELAQICLASAGRCEAVLVDNEGEASRALIDTARMRIELCSIPQVTLEEGVAKLMQWRRENAPSA